MPPLIVVEGPAAAVRRALDDVAAEGWHVVSGFGVEGVGEAGDDGPTAREDGPTVRAGVVDDHASAAAAVLAALAGHGLVVEATGPRDTIDRLVDDLRHIGSVDHRSGAFDDGPDIDPIARSILRLIAEGHSLGEAAAVLGLSRRTADRRLADGRRALGVERTTQAIALARRRGWLAPRSDPAP